MFDFALLVSAIVMVTIDYVYLYIFKGYFSNQVKNVKLIDNNGEYDYSTVYKEIDRNLIYLGH